MPLELIEYITNYGYLTIFGLVFLQELGVPNPVPNELILIFSGYLASTGKLSFSLVVLTAVAADFIGTTILYLVFYSFGTKFLKKIKFLPHKKIAQLVVYLSGRGRWGVYVGRLLPLLRGYASVAAGVLRLPPKEFIPAVILSAFTWSGGYVLLGRLLGPKWENVSNYFGFKNSLLILGGIIILYLLGLKVYDKIKKSNL
jgi:membrane protein DedA with SNARE-associated domain